MYETSARGNSLKRITEFPPGENGVEIILNDEVKFQTITGFGGLFTAAAAHLLYKMNAANRKQIPDAYQS